MDLLTVFLTLLLALIFAFIIINLVTNRPRKPKEVENLYPVALSHMLHGEDEAAIRILKELIRKNTENIDAYINLGILLRKTGKLNNAIKIHQNLQYRQNITPAQRIEILRNLCENYDLAGDKQMALRYVLQMLELDERNRWALRRAAEIYRDLKQWDKAAEYLEKVLAFELNPDMRLLALYRVQEGLSLYMNKEYHNARVVFRKALKIDPQCEAACYYIAKAYVEDKREMDSIEWWVKFAELAPNKAPLVFEPIQTILYNLGYFGNIESFYHNLLQKKPHDPEILLALARFYYKKGDIESAKATLDNLIEHHREHLPGNLLLCKIFIHQENISAANELIDKLVTTATTRDSFQCSQCGNSIAEIAWICPVCGAADSFFNKK